MGAYCKDYQVASKDFQRVMESPMSILANRRKFLSQSVTTCLQRLQNVNAILELIEKHAREIIAKPLSMYMNVSAMLGQYSDNLKISKFDIVDLLLSKRGEQALAQFNSGSLEILASISKIKNVLAQSDACFSSIYNDGAYNLTLHGLQDMLLDSGINPDLNHDQFTWNNAEEMAKIQGRLAELGQIDVYQQNLTALIRVLMADAKTFRDQAVVDLNFYRSF